MSTSAQLKLEVLIAEMTEHGTELRDLASSLLTVGEALPSYSPLGGVLIRRYDQLTDRLDTMAEQIKDAKA